MQRRLQRNKLSYCTPPRSHRKKSSKVSALFTPSRKGNASSSFGVENTSSISSPLPQIQYDAPIIIPALLNYMKDNVNDTDEYEKYMYFPTNISALDFEDAANYPPEYQYTVTGRVKKKRDPNEVQLGKQIIVNNIKLALFKYKGEIFAINDNCAHQGAPLHLGDIEELDGHPCVSCPRHGFSFDLESGACLAPKGRYHTSTYPLQIRESDMLWVGFKEITNNLFHSMDF